MPCIKTGFHAFCAPLEHWLYGDAFRLGDCFYFRICEISAKPLRDREHFQISNWCEWFDERKTSPERNSTMICDASHVVEFGYEGLPVRLAEEGDS